jgi:hypothetical protein
MTVGSDACLLKCGRPFDAAEGLAQGGLGRPEPFLRTF